MARILAPYSLPPLLSLPSSFSPHPPTTSLPPKPPSQAPFLVLKSELQPSSPHLPGPLLASEGGLSAHRHISETRVVPPVRLGALCWQALDCWALPRVALSHSVDELFLLDCLFSFTSRSLQLSSCSGRTLLFPQGSLTLLSL